MAIPDRIARWLNGPRLATWFFAVCLIFGIPLVFLYPPFLASDETAHFYRSYQVSEFRFFSEANGQEGGGFLPSSLSETVGAVKGNMLDVPGFTLALRKDIPSVPLAPRERVWTAFTGSALYSPLPYLPQAFGILIGRLFSAAPLALHYIARFCSLLTWALAGALALRIIPFYKGVLYVLLLSPLVFSKAAVVTADVVTVAACTLLVCQALKMAYGERSAGRGDVALLFVFAALVGLCKIVYAPLAALCFIIPPERLGGRKRFWKICGGAVVAAFAANLLWMACLVGNLPIRTSLSAQPGEQVRYVLSHPLAFAGIVLDYTFKNTWQNFQAIMGSLIIWREVRLPGWVIALLWANAVFAVLTDRPAVRVGARRRAGLLAIVLCEYVLVIASLYISYTRPMADFVQGMQARYMFPLLLPFLLVFKLEKGSLGSYFPKAAWAGRLDASMICAVVQCAPLAALIVRMCARFL